MKKIKNILKVKNIHSKGSNLQKFFFLTHLNIHTWISAYSCCLDLLVNLVGIACGFKTFILHDRKQSFLKCLEQIDKLGTHSLSLKPHALSHNDWVSTSRGNLQTKMYVL